MYCTHVCVCEGQGSKKRENTCTLHYEAHVQRMRELCPLRSQPCNKQIGARGRSWKLWQLMVKTRVWMTTQQRKEHRMLQTQYLQHVAHAAILTWIKHTELGEEEKNNLCGCGCAHTTPHGVYTTTACPFYKPHRNAYAKFTTTIVMSSEQVVRSSHRVRAVRTNVCCSVKTRQTTPK